MMALIKKKYGSDVAPKPKSLESIAVRDIVAVKAKTMATVTDDDKQVGTKAPTAATPAKKQKPAEKETAMPYIALGSAAKPVASKPSTSAAKKAPAKPTAPPKLKVAPKPEKPQKPTEAAKPKTKE